MDLESEKFSNCETPGKPCSPRKLYALPYTHKRPWLAMIINLNVLSAPALFWIIPLSNRETGYKPTKNVFLALVPAYFIFSISACNTYTICKNRSLFTNSNEFGWKYLLSNLVVLFAALEQILSVFFIAGGEVCVNSLTFYIIQSLVRNSLHWIIQKCYPLFQPPLLYTPLLLN